MTSSDLAARERAFSAMMTMKKPDIAALERAFADQGRPARSEPKGSA